MAELVERARESSSSQTCPRGRPRYTRGQEQAETQYTQGTGLQASLARWTTVKTYACLITSGCNLPQRQRLAASVTRGRLWCPAPGPGQWPGCRRRNVEVIVIDEISMVDGRLTCSPCWPLESGKTRDPLKAYRWSSEETSSSSRPSSGPAPPPSSLLTVLSALSRSSGLPPAVPPQVAPAVQRRPADGAGGKICRRKHRHLIRVAGVPGPERLERVQHHHRLAGPGRAYERHALPPAIYSREVLHLLWAERHHD